MGDDIVLLCSFPLSNAHLSVSDPWRAFGSNTATFKGPKSHLMRCLGNNKETRKMSGKPPKAQNAVNYNWLDYLFVKPHFFTSVIVKCKQNRTELVTIPEKERPKLPWRLPAMLLPVVLLGPQDVGLDPGNVSVHWRLSVDESVFELEAGRCGCGFRGGWGGGRGDGNCWGSKCAHYNKMIMIIYTPSISIWKSA